MKFFAKKILVTVAVFLMTISLLLPMFAIKSSAATVDYNTFLEKLTSFKKNHYAHNSTYVDNPNLTGGYECFGFANELAKYIFGSYPTSSMSAASVNKGWTVQYGGAAVDNLCVGDIVRYGYHSIFITGITGDTIYYCQANIPDGTNKVTYDNKIQRKVLKSKVSKRLTSPNTTKTGWVAHFTASQIKKTNTLTINYNANGGAIDSPDFYISSSVIYNTSTDIIAKRTLTYGQTHPNGLHDNTTFGLYRDGYTFLGWSLSASGGDIILPNTSFVPESIVPELSNGSMTVTVFAVWEANTPPVIDTTVESIAISSIPPKSMYYVGESSNQSGISIIAKHADGSYSKITEGFTCSPAVFTSEGTQTVTVNYSGKTATYSVQVTKAKEQVNNATAKVKSDGHHSPSLTSNMLPAGAYANDKLQVFCKNGDFYLCLIPWGESTTTISCGAIMYIDVQDITLKSEVPNASEFFTMNPTQTNNAVANTDTKLYWKANLKSISFKNEEIAPRNIAAGTAVKVLFEMNGNYCVESGGYIGFANKTHFTLDSTATGLQLNKTEIDTIYGENISPSGLNVKKVMSDGTSVAISNYSINLPSTDSLGTKYAVITADGFSEYIKINVVQPTIKIANAPQKNAYYLGESFDKSGLKVVSVNTDGSERDITSQISLSYDFTEVGNKSVTISYAGAKAYVPVLVYSKPVIEVGEVTGYQGQTVTLPIYYYNTCEYTFSTSFKMEISYDSKKLEYVSANIPSLTQNGQMIVNANVPGKLIIVYADSAAINDGDIMQNIKFAIKSLSDSSEGTASVEITRLELYDASGKGFESELIGGQIHMGGKLLVSYYSDGTLVDSSYKNYGESVSITETIPTKEGYTFLGWSVSSDMFIPEYYANDVFDCYEHTTLYAVWKAIPHTCVGVIQIGQGATCTTNGWNDYYKCSCGKFYTDAACTNEITDLDTWKVGAGKLEAKHNYGELVSAVTEKHTQTELVASVAAHYHCSVCDKYFTESKVETTLEALAGSTPSHSFGAWQTNDDKHWKECSCGLKVNESNHNGGTATCLVKAVCSTCQKAYGEFAEHTFGTTWLTDANDHWNECECGDKANKAAHADGNNDGRCDVCNYQIATSTPDETNKPNDTDNETSNNINNTNGDNNSNSDTKSGCGSVIGGASIVVITIMSASAFLIFRKRKLR